LERQADIALVVSARFALLCLRQPPGWNFAGAALCLVGAAYFMFRG